jgi:hypothetical protein
MEVTHSPEMSFNFQRSTQLYMPEDRTQQFFFYSFIIFRLILWRINPLLDKDLEANNEYSVPKQ